LTTRGIRAELDDGEDRMQKKIRTHTKLKVPFLLIAGETDRDGATVSFRYRDGTQRNGVPVDEAVADIVAFVASRTNAEPGCP